MATAAVASANRPGGSPTDHAAGGSRAPEPGGSPDQPTGGSHTPPPTASAGGGPITTGGSPAAAQYKAWAARCQAQFEAMMAGTDSSMTVPDTAGNPQPLADPPTPITLQTHQSVSPPISQGRKLRPQLESDGSSADSSSSSSISEDKPLGDHGPTQSATADALSRPGPKLNRECIEALTAKASKLAHLPPTLGESIRKKSGIFIPMTIVMPAHADVFAKSYGRDITALVTNREMKKPRIEQQKLAELTEQPFPENWAVFQQCFLRYRTFLSTVDARRAVAYGGHILVLLAIVDERRAEGHRDAELGGLLSIWAEYDRRVRLEVDDADFNALLTLDRRMLAEVKQTVRDRMANAPLRSPAHSHHPHNGHRTAQQQMASRQQHMQDGPDMRASQAVVRAAASHSHTNRPPARRVPLRPRP